MNQRLNVCRRRGAVQANHQVIARRDRVAQGPDNGSTDTDISVGIRTRQRHRSAGREAQYILVSVLPRSDGNRQIAAVEVAAVHVGQSRVRALIDQCGGSALGKRKAVAAQVGNRRHVVDRCHANRARHRATQVVRARAVVDLPGDGPGRRRRIITRVLVGHRFERLLVQRLGRRPG